MSEYRASFWIQVCIVLTVALLGVFTVLLSTPKAEAAGNAADLMCNPVIMVCGCGQIMVKGKCVGGANMFMCPCMDTTNGFTTPGTCVAPVKCKASGSDGMPPMLPMLPMPMPMPMPDQGQGQGDTCSGSFMGGSSSTSTKDASSTCSSYFGQTHSFDTSGYSSYFSNTSSNASTNIDTGTNTNFTPDSNGVSSLLNGNASNSSSGGTQSGSIVPGSTSAASSSAPVAPFGSKEGVSGDVQMRGQSVQVLASNRDSARGTQVSGFYGFQTNPGVTPATIFKNLCALRPWSSNFISFIVPSTYFDSLCTARNLAVGVTKAVASNASTSGGSSNSSGKPKIGAINAGSGVSVGVGVDQQTQAVSAPAPAPRTYLGKAKVDIWASPAVVTAGQRTSIFWDTSNVYTCSVSSSDRSFNGSSLSGHGATQPITKNTTFSISCETATSSVSNQVVVTVK